MFNLVSQGVSLGFSAGAMPGPMQSYLISSTLALGWRRSIIIIFAPLITDTPIMILMVVLLKQFPPEILRLIQLAGGSYLLWMAYQGWRRFRRGPVFETDAPPVTQTLGRGVLMNWLNPNPYVFWATVNGPLLVRGLQQSVWHGLAFLLAFYGTFLGFMAVYVLIFDRLRHLDERIIRAIFLLTLLVLVFFGLSLVAQGISAPA